MSFIDNQLPMLGKLLARFRKNKDKEDKEDDEDDVEEVEDSSAIQRKDSQDIDDIEDATAKDLVAPEDLTGELQEVDLELTTEDDEGEDEDEDEVPPQGLKAKLASLQGLLSKKMSKKSKKAEDEAEDEDEDEDEDGKKKGSERKFKLTPIHIIVIVGLIVFLLFDNENETPTADTQTVKTINEKTQKTKARPKEKKNVDKLPIEDAPIAEVQKEKTKDIDAEKTSDTSTEETVMTDVANSKPEQNKQNNSEQATVNIENNEILTGDEFTKEEKTLTNNTVNEVNTVDETSKKDEAELNDLFVSDDLPAPEENNIEKNSSTDDSSDNSVNDDVDKLGQDETTDLGNGQREVEVVDLTNTETGISSEILESLEKKVKKQKQKEKFQSSLRPTAAPDYNDIGRALVYNCKNQHWACVSVKSYKQCSENFDWHSSQGNVIECYPVETYVDDFDCERVQQFKIDSIASTNFCSGETQD